MAQTDPWRVGATFAITVAVCTLLFVLFPGTAMNFVTALFHGIDFRSLKASPATLADFLYALSVMAVWAFLIGALFGWLSRIIQRPA